MNARARNTCSGNARHIRSFVFGLLAAEQDVGARRQLHLRSVRAKHAFTKIVTDGAADRACADLRNLVLHRAARHQVEVGNERRGNHLSPTITCVKVNERLG